MNRSNKKTGATLIEILVTIVIFLVGILAIAQVFPGGLNILRTNRNQTMATALIRAELERLKNQADQLPVAILPTKWEWDGTRFRVVADLTRRPGDMSPAGAVQLDNTGNFLNATGQQMGLWPYLSGPNTQTRVLGEGRIIPSPRYLSLPTSTGATYGSLLSCQFAPVNYDPNYRETFLVYGNDLQLRFVEDLSSNIPLRQDYVALVDEEGTTLALPQGPTRLDVAGYERTFRLSCSVYIQVNGGLRQKDVISRLLYVPSPSAGVRRMYIPFDLATELTGPGETFVRVDLDSIQVARVFDEIGSPMAPVFLTAQDVGTNAELRDDAVYQYDFVDQKLGLMLFNPLGFNYMERRGRGRVPLQAKVDYDVYDWRIIRDDFRVPRQPPFEQKLILNSIKSLRQIYSDQRPYNGIGFVANGDTAQRDFLLVDTETGGVVRPSCYKVDYSNGIVEFHDDESVANQPDEVGGYILFPGQATPTAIKDIRGRSIRALYQGVNEWAVQVEKAVRSYQVIYDTSLGYRQAYVGGSNADILVDVDYRVYFPLSDIGKQVVIGEFWYEDQATGQLAAAYEQSFIIHPPAAGEIELGYIDIREAVPATRFRFDNGFAVRRIRGASVGVRAMWNPLSFRIDADPTQNFRNYDTWQQGWRRSRTETFLMGGVSN